MTRFFIDRPVVAIVISILLVLGGALAIRSLPIAQFPEISPPQVNVNATYLGADAVTVEQAVATPIEQQINGVQDMLYMKSINAGDGTMQLQITFDLKSDINIDNVLTQNRLTAATPSLPADVNALGVITRNTTTLPLIAFSVFSKDNRYSPEFLSNYITINIRDRILRLPGVGEVRVFGASDYAMRIWVKPDQLTRLGLTVTDLAQALRAQNVVNPAGQIGAEPALPGTDLTLTARAQGRLVTAEQFGEVVVRAMPDGSVVRLKDIARVELGTASYNQRSRFDGRPASAFGVYQQPGTNALAVADAVKKEVERVAAEFPEGMSVETAFDTTLPITEGIREITITLFIALALVMVVVFLFLQSARATLIPLVAVPVSLIGAFVLFPLIGFSINTLSLFGLVLAIGLVVDDAIVVVEAVSRHIEEGMAPREATLKAMGEVSGPVVAIAVILAAVFGPLAFVSGITGRMYQQFALTIAISVLISAFNALSLSPALCAKLLRPRRERRKGLAARAFGLFNRGFDATRTRYVRGAGLLVRKSALTILAVAVAFLVAGWLGRGLASSFVPEEDQGYFFVNLLLPDAASLQRTDALSNQVAEIIRRAPEVDHVFEVPGFSILSGTQSTNSGLMFVALKPWPERRGEQHTAKAISDRLNRQLAGSPQGLAFILLPPSIPGVGASGGFTFELQDKSGGTPEFLGQQLERFLAEARKRPEIGLVTSFYRPQTPQLFLDVNRDQALSLGAPLGDVYLTLQTFLGGSYVNDFTRFGRQWHVYLEAEPPYRASPDALRLFAVRGRNGDMVPISDLLSVKRTSGPQFTTRFNMYRAAEINGTAAPGYSSGQAMAALEQVAHEVLPPTMGFAWSGLSYQEQNAASGTTALALSLVIVFLVLAALYESWSLPWSVLLSTPVAVVGAFVGLIGRHYPSDVFSQIGLVMLVGLTAKNAILIVEFARAERQKGEPVERAALGGAELRLRPIVMTSFAFIFGCVPLWTASGAGAISRRELGTVVIVGMLLSTLLATFLIPGLFAFVERLVDRVRTRRTPKRSTKTPEPGPGAAPVGVHR
jgi:HAE1 family hydrophobic/amphiphilic exporter-1